MTSFVVVVVVEADRHGRTNWSTSNLEPAPKKGFRARGPDIEIHGVWESRPDDLLNPYLGPGITRSSNFLHSFFFFLSAFITQES